MNESVLCSTCSEENSPGIVLCKSCGAELRQAKRPLPPSVWCVKRECGLQIPVGSLRCPHCDASQNSQSTPILIIGGVKLPISEEVIVGREGTEAIARELRKRPNVEVVSRKHLEILVSDGLVSLRDLSKNGTYFNDQRIVPDVLTEANEGGEIRLGQKGPVIYLQIPDAQGE